MLKDLMKIIGFKFMSMLYFDHMFEAYISTSLDLYLVLTLVMSSPHTGQRNTIYSFEFEDK